MGTFQEGLTNGLRSAYCALGGLPPEWLIDAYRGLTPGAIQRIGESLNRWVCDSPPDYEPPEGTPEFTGGQCPNVRYTFEWSRTAGGQSLPNGISDLVGPLRLNRNANTGPTPACPDGQTYGSISMEGANGTSVSLITGCDVSANVLAVYPTFGGANNCGDPPVVLPPVAPIERPVNITYEGDDSVEYNITVPVVFAPVYVDVDGSVRIPITIGDLNFKGTLTVAPEFKVDIDFPGPAPGPRPDEPELPPPNDPNSGPPDSDFGPEGTIVGVLVRSFQNGPVRSTTLYMESMPDIVAPRCATVRFLCRFGSLRAWTTDQPVKGVNEYVPCPSPFGAIDVQVTPETNWEIASTAIRSRPPAVFDP